MFNVRLAGGHLYGKQLFTWLSLVASFVLSFCPLDVLDGIWDLIESVSEGFLTYSYTKISLLIKAPQCFQNVSSHCDLNLGSRIIKFNVFQDIVKINICVKLNLTENVRVMSCFLKIATVTLTLCKEHSNMNLSKILLY